MDSVVKRYIFQQNPIILFSLLKKEEYIIELANNSITNLRKEAKSAEPGEIILKIEDFIPDRRICLKVIKGNLQALDLRENSYHRLT